MANVFHGVKTSQVATSISTPVVAGSGITFVVGTAPVHMVNGKVNYPIMANNYSEAVTNLGYSDDFKKYSICEVIYSHFRLYQTSPVFFVNVLNPAVHKKSVEVADYVVVDGQVHLPLETIKNSVVCSEYEFEVDYDLFYDNDKLILEILDGGAIDIDIPILSISFDEVDPSKVTKSDIIGGFNISTKQTTGFELIETVFPKYGIAPDLVIAPGWSQDSEIAAIMETKASKINGVFGAKALIDGDTTEVRHYGDVYEWKSQQNIFSKEQILCWPMVKLGEKIFHMSTQAAGVMAVVDGNNDNCPCESPSNKSFKIDSAVLSDGTEVLLDLTQASYLNNIGVVTALNWQGEFKLWGNETACFPNNTDVKDYFICVSRMFTWVSNSLVLTYWSKVDGKFTRRLIDNIVDSVNIWLNGLTSEEKLLGGRIEFKAEENPLTDLMAGKAKFHIYLTPPSPAKEIGFVLEYDVNYVVSALTSAA